MSGAEVTHTDLMAQAIGGVLVTRGSVYEAADAALTALLAAGYLLVKPPDPGPCPYCAETVPEPYAHRFLGEWECHDRPAFDRPSPSPVRDVRPSELRDGTA